LRWFGVGSEAELLWTDAPWATVRLKSSGFLVPLNLANWSERLTYFLGRYYDLKLQLLMRAILKRGDRVVDIGSNIGMITLHAAALVV